MSVLCQFCSFSSCTLGTSWLSIEHRPTATKYILTKLFSQKWNAVVKFCIAIEWSHGRNELTMDYQLQQLCACPSRLLRRRRRSNSNMKSLEGSSGCLNFDCLDSNLHEHYKGTGIPTIPTLLLSSMRDNYHSNNLHLDRMNSYIMTKV